MRAPHADERRRLREERRAQRRNARREAEALAAASGTALSQADVADKYVLYKVAVQNPQADVAFIDRVYRVRYGHPPLVLHEDFCGVGALACAWAASRPDRRAVGIDLDPEPIAWGLDHDFADLPLEARTRVEYVTADVRTGGRDGTVRGFPADVVVAGNFSFCAMENRPQMVEYFRAVRGRLAQEGMFVLDVIGGADTQRDDHRVVRHEPGFDYVWEQRSFDPITYRAAFAIHFRFADGSELRNAFGYEWRLWTLPELQELLLEAGFSDSTVHWEMSDPATGRGNGVFRPVIRAPAEPVWLAELVAFP